MPFKSATEQLCALRHKDLTSVELVEAAIARIEDVDRSINAVVVRDFARGRAAALDADRERESGRDRPLLGLPVTVKEAFDVAGLPTSWGLPGTYGPATTDAVVVERLRRAGAVILGKTNVPAMLSDWQTANAAFGVTNNPWDPGRTAGGSSGGGAAAVAAGMTSLEFGSDLAGSLRIPAAFCGVFAHRPSHGIVPTRGFAPPMVPRTPMAPTIDQSTLGPIARHAADLRLALGVIAGPDTLDATAFPLALPAARHAALRDFRVLVLDTHPMVSTSDSIRAALANLANRLEAEGCSVARGAGEIPDMSDLTRTFGALLMSMLGADMPEEQYAAAARTANDASPDRRAMTMSHREWVWLDRHRLELSAHWVETFKRWDVVVCPAAPATAFRHDHRPFDERTLDVDGSSVGYEKTPFWAALAAPCGLPATAVPLGIDAGGLPVGVQIIGPRLEDHTPLMFAELLESRLGCAFVAPPAPQAKTS
jgi:amidase